MAAVLVGLTSGLLATTDAGIAEAVAVPASYTADATADGVGVGALSVLNQSPLAGLALSRAAGSVASSIPSTTSTATNVAGSLLGLGLTAGSVGQTALPDHPAATTGGLPTITVPGLLAAQAVTASAHARFGSTASCLPSGTPLTATSSTLAGATVGPAALGIGASLLDIGAVTTTTGTTLAALPGSHDPRAVQTDAAAAIASTSVLDGALTIGVANPVTLRATASGSSATSRVAFVDSPVISITGGGQPQTLTAGQSTTIPALDLGGLLTGSVTVTAGSVTSTANTGASEAGTAFAYRVGVTVSSLGSPIDTASVTVGALSAAAGVPSSGLQCQPAVPAAPVVTTQPVDQTVNAGGRATFAVGCSGASTIRWQRAARGSSTYTDIPGATGSTYTTAAEAVADSGARYRAVCANTGGATASRGATVTVDVPAAGVAPRITLQPSDATIFAGQQVTLTAAASGTPEPTVTWQSAPRGSTTFRDVPGAHGLSYATPRLGAGATGTHYRAVFHNARGTATTRTATVTVRPLEVTAFLVPHGIRVGAVRVVIPFTVETNGPAGTVSVRLLRASSGAVLASSTVAGGHARLVRGSVRFGIGSPGGFGAYRWVVTIGNDKGTTLTRRVAVEANAEIVAHLRGTGSRVVLTGRARRWNVSARAYQWWAGQHVIVQERTSHGWRTVEAVTTGTDGTISARLSAPRGTLFRICVHATGVIAGRISNTVHD